MKQGAGKPPKSADDYAVDVSDEVMKALFADGDASKDDVMKALNQKMFEKGVSQEVYGAAMNVALEALSEHINENPGPDPIDPKAERGKLGKNADAIIKNQTEFLSQMFKQGHVNEEQMQEILILTETAAGINALASDTRLLRRATKYSTEFIAGFWCKIW